MQGHRSFQNWGFQKCLLKFMDKKIPFYKFFYTTISCRISAVYVLYILCKGPCVASVEPVSPSLQQRYCLQLNLKGFALDVQGLPFSSGVIGFSGFREKQQYFPAWSFLFSTLPCSGASYQSFQQRCSLFFKGFLAWHLKANLFLRCQDKIHTVKFQTVARLTVTLWKEESSPVV